MIIKLYLLWRSVSNDDGFHLYLKWLHSYFVLFVQFIPEAVTILETIRGKCPSRGRSAWASPAPGPPSSSPPPPAGRPWLTRPGMMAVKDEMELELNWAFRIIYVQRIRWGVVSYQTSHTWHPLGNQQQVVAVHWESLFKSVTSIQNSVYNDWQLLL